MMTLRWRMASLTGGLAALALGSISSIAPAHSEGFDRVYEVQLQLVPTPLVAGNGPVATETLKTQLGPNMRLKRLQKAESIGQGAYRLGQYRMRVHLHHGDDGGYDNGTMSYVVSASLSRASKDHTASIFTRVKGVLALHDGQAAASLPANRYFAGTIQINAIATGL